MTVTLRGHDGEELAIELSDRAPTGTPAEGDMQLDLSVSVDRHRFYLPMRKRLLGMWKCGEMIIVPADADTELRPPRIEHRQL